MGGFGSGWQGSKKTTVEKTTHVDGCQRGSLDVEIVITHRFTRARRQTLCDERPGVEIHRLVNTHERARDRDPRLPRPLPRARSASDKRMVPGPERCSRKIRTRVSARTSSPGLGARRPRPPRHLGGRRQRTDCPCSSDAFRAQRMGRHAGPLRWLRRQARTDAIESVLPL